MNLTRFCSMRMMKGCAEIIRAKRNTLHVLLFTFSTILSGFSQQKEFGLINEKFDAFRKSTLQEKIYVHTDRSSYLTGETLWFKVYLTDGSLHKPLGLSKVVYLEITDADHKPILQTKISMQSGIGNGSLYLPPNISSGNYHLRAYTSWMKNFSADFFFSKTITILNTFRQLDDVVSKQAAPIDIQFFPEGGSLVYELESRVAFRAINTAGAGVPIQGIILNQKNDTIVKFSPVQFGIGSFLITPQHNEQYRAAVMQSTGELSYHTLPQALENGYTLNLIDDNSDKLLVRVQANFSNTTIQSQVYLFVHSRNIITSKSFNSLSDNGCTFVIDKNLLAEGISHFTLFDSQLNPVCERLYFKQPENLLSITLHTDNNEYGSRRKVTLDMKTGKKNNNPTPSDLSVSIYKLDSLPEHSGNIVTSFWLTSDLKGTIESPDYYFSSTSDEVRRAADNLMLTHGWRRFQWKDVLNNHVDTPFIPELRGPIIKGTVVNNEGTPGAGIIAYLASPGKIIRLYTSISTESGDVIFEIQKLKGSTNLIIQTNPKKDSAYTIRIENPYSEQPLSKKLYALKLLSTLSQPILERSVAMQVQDIYYEEKLEISSQLANDSTAFYGKGDEVYLLDDFTRFPVMEEVMREYVKGVWVRRRKNGFHFRVLDNATINRPAFENSPLMLLDGVPFFDEDNIMEFNPLKVRQIDVVTRRYYLGPASFPGVVSFRTYSGDLAGFPLNPHSQKIDFEGLQHQREFYSPRYDNAAQRKNRMPDQRLLLYWNPNVVTNLNGETQLEFFTSDISGVFQIVVEGTTTDGVIGSSTASFQVQEK